MQTLELFIMEFAIIGNNYQGDKIVYTKNLIAALQERGAIIKMCKDFYDNIYSIMNIDLSAVEIFEEMDQFTADVVVSMGGDGTLLNAARFVGNREIPIIGINTGRLGFVANNSPFEIDDIIDDIYKKNYKLEDRCVIQLCCNNEEILKPYALNEIAILKRDDAAMLTIETNVDNSILSTYQSDGLIISTPTGSTAYSLSVGGPIIEPNSKTLLITPIAPHSLNVRPFVLRDDVEIKLKVKSRNHVFLISIDGVSYPSTESTELTIKKANHTVKIIRRNNHSFYDTLRDKLLWGADKR